MFSAKNRLNTDRTNRMTLGTSQAARKRRSAAIGAAVEPLEDRTLFSFIAAVGYPVGASASGVAVGDFNGDGHADVVTVNNASGGGMANVMLNNGDGTFQAPASSPTGNTPVGVRVGDFNGDGKQDIAVIGSYYISALTILYGNGDGTFQPPQPYNFNVPPTEIDVADVNGDGHPDLIMANRFFSTASVMLNNGDGTFAPKTDFFAGSSPDQVQAADFNGDGKIDLVCNNDVGLGTISVLKGNGDGTFQPRVTYNAGLYPAGVVVGDFNHDGYQDVTVPNSYAGTRSMSVLLGNGDGTFKPYTMYDSGGQPLDLQSGDFNGDGIPDMVERETGGYAVEISRGDGSFYPATMTTAWTGTYTAAADFNGDGVADVVSVGGATMSVSINDNLASTTLGGAVGFQVSAVPSTTAGVAAPVTVTAIDANGNVATNFTGTVAIQSNDPLASLVGTSYTFTAADAGIHTILAGNLFTVGTDTLTISSPFLKSTTQTINVTPAAASKFSVSGPATTVAGTPGTFTVTALDPWNNIAAGYLGTIKFNSSDSQAALPGFYTFSAANAGVQAFSATFKTAGNERLSAIDTSSALVNGSSASVLVTPASASSFALSGGGGYIGLPHAVTVTAKDAYGNAATGYNGTVDITSSDAAAILPPDAALASGTGTFLVTPMTLGLMSVTATDTTTASITGTETGVLVTPGQASKFVMTQVPATVAGQTQTFTVTAYDSFGDLSTVYNGSVVFSSSDFRAALPGFYTFTAADAGQHTFSVALRTAGSQSLTVRDWVNTTVTSTQTGIAVSPAAASSISVPFLSNGVAGTVQNVTIVARDPYGNIATGYTGTLAFSSTDPIADLPANYTFTASDVGTHTFGVTLKSSGNTTFNVQDTANLAMASSQRDIIVAPAPLSTFAFRGTSLSNTVAGATFGLTVTATDAYGNTIAGYTGTALISSTDPQISLPSSYTFTGADAGSHIFSVALKTAGTQSITLTDSANGAITGVQGAILVRPAATSKLSLATSGAATAGAAQAVTVTASDGYGNVSTGYIGTASFSSSDAQAVLPANYTFTNKDAGAHTFNVTFKTSGTQSITAADTVNAGISATQAGIVVSTPVVTVASFAVSGFPATTAGSAKTFTVVARDAKGNVVTNYTGTLNFSSSDAKAGLPASYTFTAADAGSHTFSATFKTAGTQSITVADAAAGSVVGSETGIIITAGTASQFVLSTPASVTQGVGFKFTMTVLDAFGNVATGYRGKVHLSSTDAKSGTSDYTFSSSDNGVHVFSFTFNTLGSQTVKLADSTNSSLLGSAMVSVLSK